MRKYEYAFGFGWLLIVPIMTALFLPPYFIRAHHNARIANCRYDLVMCRSRLQAYAKKHKGNYPKVYYLRIVAQKSDPASYGDHVSKYLYSRPPAKAAHEFTILKCHDDKLEIHLDGAIHAY